MTKEQFDLLYKFVIDKHSIAFSLNEKNADEYLELLNEWTSFCNQYDDDKYLVDAVLLYCMFWGIITFSSLQECKENDDVKTRMCIATLSNTITNNILSIYRLYVSNLEYQAGIIVRNTVELCFQLIVIIIDCEKRKAYMEADTEVDEYQTWRRFFTVKKMNERIIQYEDETKTSEELSFLIKWRENLYSFYSSFAHNSYSTALAYFYIPLDIKSDQLFPNIWGFNGKSVSCVLREMADLIFWTSIMFYNTYVTSREKETINPIIDTSSDFWHDGLIVYYMAQESLLRYKLSSEIENK